MSIEIGEASRSESVILILLGWTLSETNQETHYRADVPPILSNTQV